MAVDLNDDNVINEKALNFWEKNKKNILYGAVFFVSIYLASNFYFSNQKNSQFLASEIYQKIQVEFEKSDISEYVKELKEKYPESPYAARASLIAARNNLKNQNMDEAISNYDWAINNTNEKSIESLALFSKAKLQFINGNLDLSEQTVNKINSNGYEGLKNYLLGDIYQKRNLNKKALAFYETAYSFYLNKNDLSKVIKTKIDAIGN